MAIPDPRQARTACSEHVQIEVRDVELPARFPGAARLRGRVVRVFRGSLKLDTELLIDLNVMGEGFPPSGDFYYLPEELRCARIVEACLDGCDGALHVPTNSCTAIVPAATDRPQLEWEPVAVVRRRGLLARLFGWR